MPPRHIDETGRVYGRLTVLASVARREAMFWSCRCMCGATRIVSGSALRRGLAKSCGCHRRDQLAAYVQRKTPDETGRRYGRLVVIARADRRDAGYAQWDCQCDCGATCVVRGTSLRDGTTHSCGCLQPDIARHQSTIHGESPRSGRSREHRAWKAMKERCHYPQHRGWKHYGGRGITVCERWRDSFDQFLSDVGRCPPGLTLDRIDVNGHYEPGNVRWATWSQQALNKRPRTSRLHATERG